MIVTQLGPGYVSYQQVKVTVDGLHVHWINKRRRNELPIELSQDPRHKQHFRLALKDEQQRWVRRQPAVGKRPLQVSWLGEEPVIQNRLVHPPRAWRRPREIAPIEIVECQRP